jgi:molecular chaperone DnaK
LHELGDKVQAEEKTKIEAAIEDLRKAMGEDNKEEIDRKTEALAELSGKMAERLYAQKGEEAPAAGEPEQPASSGEAEGDVVDAEFEEVKDNKK